MTDVVKVTSKALWNINLGLDVKLERWGISSGTLAVRKKKFLGMKSKKEHIKRCLNLKVMS